MTPFKRTVLSSITLALLGISSAQAADTQAAALAALPPPLRQVPGACHAAGGPCPCAATAALATFRVLPPPRPFNTSPLPA